MILYHKYNEYMIFEKYNDKIRDRYDAIIWNIYSKKLQ